MIPSIYWLSQTIRLFFTYTLIQSSVSSSSISISSSSSSSMGKCLRLMYRHQASTIRQVKGENIRLTLHNVKSTLARGHTLTPVAPSDLKVKVITLYSRKLSQLQNTSNIYISLQDEDQTTQRRCEFQAIPVTRLYKTAWNCQLTVAERQKKLKKVMSVLAITLSQPVWLLY